MIEEFYKGFSKQEDRNIVIEPWTGPLEKPITEQAFAQTPSNHLLSNGRTTAEHRRNRIRDSHHTQQSKWKTSNHQ